ncbi:MAG: tRNA (adenosine(37)-N6)-threonylcarbamoyltransferase complex ATPase subunit type 1 TsaE [Acidobacteria bacterium]|nr:MAG: tRNA (adenosine(37)-N6)-threonylcarbamoyltransferase complex ATPase subunit type 1 TsaE [Acidobacteriota bacterium]
MKSEWTSHSPEETIQVAEQLGDKLTRGDIVLLSGPLGSGKTLFVKGLCRALKLDELWEVDSPTYTIMKKYATDPPCYHFDLYRIHSEDELESLAFYEIMESANIKVVEWPERLVHYRVPGKGFLVQFVKLEKTSRRITVTSFSAENE